MWAHTLRAQRCLCALFAICLVLSPCFAMTATPVHAAAQAHPAALLPADWWSAPWAFRVPLSVNANGYQRTDHPVEMVLNFTGLLSSANQTGAFDPASLRLVEVDTNGIVNDNVPFQFDQNSDYNATENAVGSLTFLLLGRTEANTIRTFHLYFDRQGKGFAPLVFANHTAVATVDDEGQSSFRVQTDNATYFYQKAAGGFSTLLDSAGNDWINYHATPANSAGGAYRGIPNMVYPEGKLHPGATGHTTTLLHTGPLKTTMRTVINTDSDAQQWDLLWEFFPRFARMTVVDYDHDYWFLYEGTPGGVFEPESDFVVRADGTQTLASASWTADLPGEEWLYFADPATNRALFLVNHTEDSTIDSYRPMSDSGGSMTVFGFGRKSANRYLAQANRVFTIGLIDETNYSTAAPVVRGIYRPLLTTIGLLEQHTRSAAQITIIKDAQPNAKRNFSFRGDLGSFRLDDPKVDDGDLYGNSHTVTVDEGVYTVRENAASGWGLTNISCSPTSSAAIDLGARQVRITATAGQQISCTFVNVKQTILRVQRLDAQADQRMTIYTADGALIDSQQTNHFGKISFNTLLPGSYEVCSDTPGDCTVVRTASNQVTEVTIRGDAKGNIVTTAQGAEDFDEVAEDELDGDEGPTGTALEDPWLSIPVLRYEFYLPLIATGLTEDAN